MNNHIDNSIPPNNVTIKMFFREKPEEEWNYLM